jgi:hypothetical protein
MGIEPQSPKAWADMANRFARSLQLAPDRGPAGVARSDKRETKSCGLLALFTACEAGRRNRPIVGRCSGPWCSWSAPFRVRSLPRGERVHEQD